MKAVIGEFYTKSRDSTYENRNGIVMDVVREDGIELGTYFMSLDGTYLERKLGEPKPSSEALKGFASDEALKTAIRDAIPRRLDRAGERPVIYAEALKFAAEKDDSAGLQHLILRCDEKACTWALFEAVNARKDRAMEDLIPHSYPSHFTNRQRERLYEPWNVERTNYVNQRFVEMHGNGKEIPPPLTVQQKVDQVPNLVPLNVTPQTVNGVNGLRFDVRAQDPWRNFEAGPISKSYWMSLDLKELKRADGTGLDVELQAKRLGFKDKAEFVEKARDCMENLKGEAIGRAGEIGDLKTVKYLQEFTTPQQNADALMRASNSTGFQAGEVVKELAKHSDLDYFDKTYGEKVKELPGFKSFALKNAIEAGKEFQQAQALRQEQEALEPTRAPVDTKTQQPNKEHDNSLKPEDLASIFMSAIERGDSKMVGKLKDRVAAELPQEIANDALYLSASRNDWECTKHLLAISKSDTCRDQGWEGVETPMQKFITKFHDQSSYGVALTKQPMTQMDAPSIKRKGGISR